MTPREQEFLRRLRATFEMEAAEHLGVMGAELLALEKLPPGQDPSRYETIFRTAHSLKGAARAVSARDVEVLCQAMEGVFARWKRGEASPEPSAFDVFHRALELLQALIAGLQTQTSGAAPHPGVAEVVSALQGVSAGAVASPVSPAAPSAPPAKAVAAPVDTAPSVAAVPAPVATPAGAPATPPAAPAGPAPAPTPAVSESRAAATVRISVQKLDRLLRSAEELIGLKQAARKRAGELREIAESLAEWDRRWAGLRNARHSFAAAGSSGDDATAGQASHEAMDFLDWTSARIRATASRLAAAQLAARREGRAADKLVDEVLEGAKQLLMLPVSTVTDSLPLVARQIGREQSKEIDLVVQGGEVEMDKRVLDELRDPLIHLVRNAADHGVEPSAERVRAGKPAAARISITVGAVDGAKVEIALADDGAGIDVARVRAAAVRRGFMTAEAVATLDEARSIALIFESDVTTSPIVTDISGRGLGLAIVREKVEKLGGRVLVETKLGRGTIFRLIVPVALASFRGLVVRANRRSFVLPVSAVERVARVPAAEVRTVGGRETITLQGGAIPLSRLATALELPAEEAPPPPAHLAVVVVTQRDERVAFVVDEVSHDEEVLVKHLAPPLRRVRNVAGATLLASGALVPVLNPGDLMRTARRARSAVGAAGPVAAARGPLSVLVTDDSVTSRMLIKGILEAAGHRVTTTVDGMEALEALRAGAFDLVVSDVEMPRMTGFDLTARIRAERRLADLPVILVTALASPRDRERGIEVGASAYIVKSEFDQGNLLEIIRRLAG